MILLVCLAAQAEPLPPVAAEMHERFSVLTTMRDHVVQGRLEPTREEARRLVDMPPPQGLPEPWRPWLAQLHAEAAGVAAARDLAGAAQGVAKIALACGDCHSAMESGPGLRGASDIPPQKWDEGQNMSLHEWAISWMWLGLIRGDDAAWSRGASELDRQPLVPKFEEAPPPGGLRELEQLVYVIAARSLETEEPMERAELFGNLLGTCAQCHVKRPGGSK